MTCLDGSALKARLAKFDELMQNEPTWQNSMLKELVALLLQGRVKDPDNQCQKSKITAERPLPFNGEGKGFKKKGKGGNKGGGRYGRDRNNNRGGRGGDRDGKGGYRGKGGDRDRDDKKRNWRDRDDKTGLLQKRP